MSNDSNWVLYKEIKQNITIEMVLNHYGLMDKLKPAGKSLVGCCPIHAGTNPRQFSVNLERNIWNCFGNCKAGGNILDLVSQIEKVDIHGAALKLKNWFPLCNHTGQSKKIDSEASQGSGIDAELVRKKDKEPKGSENENKPLTFKLRLDPEHPFFDERNISPETRAHFEIGLCSKGMLKGRIAIPIHDHLGNLVAYCGRAVNDEQKEEAKYKLPPNFHKQEVVFNLHRQEPGTKRLILVESFLSVFCLHQAGFKNAVALMGSVLSPSQEDLIASFLGSDGICILMFDADEDGQKCTKDCLQRLSTRLFVRAVDISPYARKPHQLAPEQLKNILLI